MTDQTAADAPAETTPDPLAEYKAQVRAKALKLKSRFNWCREETNEHLAELGLELLPEPKEYVFHVPTAGVLEYRYTEYSEEAARERAQRVAESDVARLGRSPGSRCPHGTVVSVTADVSKLKLHGAESTDNEVNEDY